MQPTEVERVPRKRHTVTLIALIFVPLEIFLMTVGVLPQTMPFVLMALSGLCLGVAYDD